MSIQLPDNWEELASPELCAECEWLSMMLIYAQDLENMPDDILELELGEPEQA